MKLYQKLIYKTFSGKTPIMISGVDENFMKVRKVLLLRQDRLGDVLITIPFLNAFTKNFPELELQVVLGVKNIQLAPLLRKYCKKIWFYDKKFSGTTKLISGLRREKFDLAIDLFDNPSRTSSLILNLLNVPIKLGFDKENANTYTHLVPLPSKTSVHIVERLFNLLLPFGLNPSEINEKIDLDIPLPVSDILPKRMGKKRLGMILSGSTSSKSWGEDNYILFAKKFAESFTNYEIVVFATRDTLEMQTKISEQSPVIPAPLVHNFLEFASMIKMCDFIITPDTSVVHLSAAFGIPSAVLYYSSEIPPKYMPWTPYKTNYLSFINDVSVQEINVEEVIDALKNFEHFPY